MDDNEFNEQYNRDEEIRLERIRSKYSPWEKGLYKYFLSLGMEVIEAMDRIDNFDNLPKEEQQELLKEILV
jgi:hypothetical protein